MKSKVKIITVFFVLLTSCIVYPRQTSAQETNVSFQVFYDQLSPYGQWVDDSNYGYVWIPDAGADFVPYSTDGHWVLTDVGWTWASDYNWGWAVFHYGRWSYADTMGWFWVPDNEWGPAWVNWRQADGYYGWSPMEPGITLSVSFGRPYDNRNDHWMFVRDRDIERSDINHYYINHSDQDRIGRSSVVINNTYLDNGRHTTYVSGPSRIQVQKVVGRTITPVVIRENARPGSEISNGQLRIYRPQVVKNGNDGSKAAPTRITNINEVKRKSAGNSTDQNRIGTPGNRTISQPVRTAEPQNTNPQPVKQQNITPQNTNQQDPQKRTSNPSNADGKAQPYQPQRPVPSNMDKPVSQPGAVTAPANSQPAPQRNITPQNNMPQPIQNKDIRNDQPVRSKDVTPADNSPRPAMHQNVSPQNNPVQQNQPGNVAPQNNNSQQLRPQNVAPQNNNPQPVRSQNAAPQNNNTQPVHQQITAPQNNNPGLRTPPPATMQNQAKPVQPQNVRPSNKRPAKQQKSIKQQVKAEQAKTPDAVTDKK